MAVTNPAGIGVNPGAPQTWNRYAYVSNGPLNAVDPLGLKPKNDCNRGVETTLRRFLGGSGVYVDGVELPNFSGLGGDLVDAGAATDITTSVTTTIIAVPYIEIGGSATCTADYCTGVTHLDFGASVTTYTEYLPSLQGSGAAGSDIGDDADKLKSGEMISTSKNITIRMNNPVLVSCKKGETQYCIDSGDRC